MPGMYRRESSLLISEHVPKGQRSLGDLSRNKGAGRGQFPPLSPSINTWPPIGTTLVLTLPNLLTPVPYSSLSPCAVFQSRLVSSQACLSPETAGPLPQRASGPNLANTAGLLHCPTPPPSRILQICSLQYVLGWSPSREVPHTWQCASSPSLPSTTPR